MELVQMQAPGFSLRQLNWRDWGYALLILVAAGVAYSRYGHAMDGYVQAILAGSVVGTLAMFLLSGIRLRLALLCGSALWLANNLLSGSIGGSALETMIALTNMTTITRMWVERSKRRKLEADKPAGGV